MRPKGLRPGQGEAEFGQAAADRKRTRRSPQERSCAIRPRISLGEDVLGQAFSTVAGRPLPVEPLAFAALKGQPEQECGVIRGEDECVRAGASGPAGPAGPGVDST